MTETVPTDDLLQEAQARLAELEEQGDGDELGDRVEIEPGSYFRGRWRGEGQMHTKEDVIDVYLLWDAAGKLGFHYKNAALIDEVAEATPAIGDEVVIVRGKDREFEAQGEQRRQHRYAVRARPSPDPLPGGAEKPADGSDEELPF